MGLGNICTRCLLLVLLISGRCSPRSWQAARKSSEGLHLKGKDFRKSTMGQDLQEVLNQVGEHRQIRLEYVQHLFTCLSYWTQIVPLT